MVWAFSVLRIVKKLKRAVILLAIAAVLYGCGAEAGSVSEDMAAADAEYRKMISGEAEGEDVCLVYTDDFENKGAYQAFAFAGNLVDDTNYEGKLWFIDNDKKQLVSGDALLVLVGSENLNAIL